MAKPAHVSLLQQTIHAGDSSSLQDSGVWDFILPLDVQDASQAAHVEGIELVFLPCSDGPRLTAIRESAHYAGAVDLYFGML